MTKRLLASAIAVLAAAATHAQTSPYYVGASLVISHESNLLRLADGQATPAGFSKADTTTTAALLAGFDQAIGRQRLFGNATLRDSRLSSNSVYNNNGYSLSGGLDWSTAERVSGSFSGSTNRNLARFNAEEIGFVTRKNVETTEALDALVRVGLVTQFSAEAGLNYRAVRYSAPEYQSREFHQNGGTVGLRWRPSSASTFGVALRQANGRYPKFQTLADGSFASDSYSRRDLDLTATLAPNAVSTYDARLSFGRTRYDVATQRDFSGLTGDLAWHWRPTGKLRLSTRLTRDTGQDSYFLDSRATTATVDYSRLTTSLRTRATYDVTAKIAVTAGLGYTRRSLVRTSPFASGGSTLTDSDNGTDYSLGVRWLPTRSVQLGCDVGGDRRNGGGVLAADVSGNNFSCFGQITLQ